MCRTTYTDFYLHPELKNKQSTLPRCPTTSVHLTHRATTPLCVRCRSQTTTFDGLESTPLVLLARTGTPRVQRHVRLCSQPWQSQCQYQYDTKTQCDIQTHTAWHTDTHIVWHTDLLYEKCMLQHFARFHDANYCGLNVQLTILVNSSMRLLHFLQRQYRTLIQQICRQKLYS